MDHHKKSCAERMRPILQAMERSIDAARRNRIQPAAADERPTHASLPPHSPPMPMNHSISTGEAETAATPQRLKARAKRIESPFNGSFGYRPQTS